MERKRTTAQPLSNNHTSFRGKRTATGRFLLVSGLLRWLFVNYLIFAWVLTSIRLFSKRLQLLAALAITAFSFPNWSNWLIKIVKTLRWVYSNIPAAGIVRFYRWRSLFLAVFPLAAFMMIRVVITFFIFQFWFGLTSLNTTVMLFIALVSDVSWSSLVVIRFRRSLRTCRRVARILSGRRWRFYFGARLSSTMLVWLVVADVTNGILSVCVGIRIYTNEVSQLS